MIEKIIKTLRLKIVYFIPANTIRFITYQDEYLKVD